MSSPISQDQATSPSFQRTWLVAIALIVWTMQIGLTCWLLVESDRQYRVAFKLSFEGFEWNGCLLRAFAHPFNTSDNNPISPASATVCGDEVIVLFKKEQQYGHSAGALPFEPAELVRFNFKTSHVTSSMPPKGVRHLLSDGHTLWFLPQFNYEDDHVFLRNGIPSLIDFFEAKAIPRLVEFTNERWTKTDRCALTVQPSVFWGQRVDCGIYQANGQTYSWVGRHDCFYFRHGVEFGSEEDYARFQEPFRESLYEAPEDKLRQLGWTRIKNSWLQLRGAQEVELFRSLGYWFEDDQPFAIAENDSFLSDPKKLSWGPIFSLDDDFRTADIESLLTTGSKLHEVQIPNPWRVDKRSLSVQYQFVNSHDGRKFLVCRHQDDGRMHLFEFANGQLKLITWRRSWVVWQACLDAITFISVVIVGPSLVLGVLARLRQRRSAFDVGTDFVMASVLRRGIARAIDLSLVVGFLALSIVLHPDVMTWWTDCILDMSETLDLLSDVSNYNWASRDWFATSVLDLTNDLLSVPFIPWLFISALILAALQIVWQARSGRTIGKRLVGIKVLRTTLRPCGFTRSLLREILLVIDSLCLLSWVPGVIAILSSRRGQRIGDYWAETIVVRDVRQTPSIQPETDRSPIVGTEAKPTLPLNEFVN